LFDFALPELAPSLGHALYRWRKVNKPGKDMSDWFKDLTATGHRKIQRTVRWGAAALLLLLEAKGRPLASLERQPAS
jgi:hypothetical protein